MTLNNISQFVKTKIWDIGICKSVIVFFNFSETIRMYGEST